jgi:hypothetical protein
MMEQIGGFLLKVGLVMLLLGLDNFFTTGPGEKWSFGMGFSFFKLPESISRIFFGVGIALCVGGTAIIVIF